MLGRGIPVTVLAKLDKKIDDGYPASGLIRYVGHRVTLSENSRLQPQNVLIRLKLLLYGLCKKMQVAMQFIYISSG